MAKHYRSVPLDEEQTRSSAESTIYEKGRLSIRLEDDKLEGDVRTRLLDFAFNNWAWIGHIILLSSSITLFMFSFCHRPAKPTDLQVTQQFSSYSPAAPTVKYEAVRFNLTPVPEGPFVGYGPDVDAAWDHIATDVGDQMISQDELDRLGLPKDSVKITDSATGKEGYRASVEVFHQLHCLNLLRQYVYKDYYINVQGDIQDEEKALKLHVDHCIETIRVNLMCTADIGVYTYREFPEYGFKKGDYRPDFSTPHMCRNFDAIHDWAMDHTVSRAHNA